MQDSNDIKTRITLGRSPAFEKALKALDDLRDSGHAVVPVQPTTRMIAAAAQVAGLTPEAVKHAYKVMLLAGAQED